MEKADSRAKAEELRLFAREDCDPDDWKHSDYEIVNTIEAALTAAYDKGWDEGVEAAAAVSPEQYPDAPEGVNFDDYITGWIAAMEVKDEAIKGLA